MGLFNFKRKEKFTEHEKEIILGAYKYVQKDIFTSLYVPVTNVVNFKKYGYDSQEQAINAKMNYLIEAFLKNSNYLEYIIYNSENLYNKLKGDTDKVVLNNLGAFVTMLYRLKHKEYIIRKHKDTYYPAALCGETPEETRMRFIELLKPIVEMK